ncbi:MAG: hypothetical protein H7337_10905 [Rhizobacter sp.]|nr:hypothetical protein [Rhizobacter sp.]
MPMSFIKRKILDLYRYNVQPRVEALHAEQIFQGIFQDQCRQRGIDEPFYPVGAAAGYSLMYLLVRALSELPIKDVLELGSGQTTILIDRLRGMEGTHVTYEQSELWAASVSRRAPRCQLIHSPLVERSSKGVTHRGFEQLIPTDFDLLLVDGPNGTDHASRYDCVQLVEANRKSEFIIIVDDADRPGERETLQSLADVLRRRGIDFKLNYVSGRTTQAVITTPGMRAASYFF